MNPPVLLGHPITLLLLYFVFYSFCGWLWETTYCSIRERRYVPRGFLYGPLCPIYGVGFLLMVFFFEPLKDNLVVFYFVAVFVMTLWEYFVGWFLETTTHIKYWDYSHFPLNIKGRVCLYVSLFWGFLSYAAVFWVHPPVSALLDKTPLWLQYTLCGSFSSLILLDMATTVSQLALVTSAMNRLQATGDELRLQLTLARADLGDNLDELSGQVRTRLDAARGSLPPTVGDRLDRLTDEYEILIRRAEQLGRRFRTRYADMTSRRYTLGDVRAYGLRWSRHLKAAKTDRREQHRIKNKKS